MHVSQGRFFHDLEVLENLVAVRWRNLQAPPNFTEGCVDQTDRTGWTNVPLRPHGAIDHDRRPVVGPNFKGRAGRFLGRQTQYGGFVLRWVRGFKAASGLL